MSDSILLQSRNMYEQQTHNRRMTWIVVGAMIVLFAFLGLGLDYFYLGLAEGRYPVPLATVAAIIGGILYAAWSLEGGMSMVLHSTGAVPADPSDPSQKQLLNVVKEMSLAAGLPMPEVYIIPDEDPNAFATGKNPENSAIAVTQGLLDMLDREELQGVIAHEMSHIRYYDVRLMTVVAALVGTIVLLSDIVIRGMRFGRFSGRSSRSRSSNPLGAILFIVWILALILAPLLTNLMAMMTSRKREYLADASAAELTRNPLALAKALEIIEDASEPTKSIKRGVAHLCVADPMGKPVNEKEGSWAELFATHPPMAKRITLLQSMAYQTIR